LRFHARQHAGDHSLRVGFSRGAPASGALIHKRDVSRHHSTGLLAASRAVTKLPAQDLDRARAFYRDKLGLEPVEKREGGLRYCCAAGEFHLFLSSGAASGTSTQMGFEVDDIDATIAELRARGVVFEVDDAVEAPDNYPSKGTGERGNWFRDSEGNLLGLGQPTS
jgi:catechol 2,3-dioxygenase-like lactoylglutathione lyase family enzyme